MRKERTLTSRSARRHAEWLVAELTERLAELKWENEQFNEVRLDEGVCRRPLGRSDIAGEELLSCTITSRWIFVFVLELYLHDLACQPCCSLDVYFYPSLFSPFFVLCNLYFFSPATRTWRLGWQGVMSGCPGLRPGWPYLFARDAWCFRLSSLHLLCSCLFSLLVRTAGCLSLSPSLALAEALHVGFFFFSSLVIHIPLLLSSWWNYCACRGKLSSSDTWRCLSVFTNLVGPPLAVTTTYFVLSLQDEVSAKEVTIHTVALPVTPRLNLFMVCGRRSVSNAVYKM